MRRWQMLGGLFLCLLFGAAAFVFALHPALFPQPLEPPSFQVDPAEGKVWLDSQVVIEVRGSLSPAEVLERLKIRPRVEIQADDVAVQRIADYRWHEGFPWAKTRVTINPGHARLFRPETRYKIELGETSAAFETITLPRVIDTHLLEPFSRDIERVPTTSSVLITFNEEIAWHDRHLKIEPETEIKLSVETNAEGHTQVRIDPATRWQNSTTYVLSLAGAVQDEHGHIAEQPYSFSFSTWPRPRVLSVTPQEAGLGPHTPLTAVFERDVDRASVEQSFRTEPHAGGSFEWADNRSFTWRPDGLQYSTRYTAYVGGVAAGGDEIVPAEWSFATHDPPVFVEIRGRRQTPAILEAVAGGGTGVYSYEWSTGDNEWRILHTAPPEETQTLTVTVRSGDQVATASFEVLGPPASYGYVPQPCPPGWAMAEISVCYREEVVAGPTTTYVARIDLKDPALQVRSLPTGGFVGVTGPASGGARANGAIVAVNGDFFHAPGGRPVPLGPMASGGSFAFAPVSQSVVLALDNARNTWVGPAADLRFFAESGDGGRAVLQAVNEPPWEHGLSLFNGYWGARVDLGVEGCWAAVRPPGPGLTGPEAAGCGPLNGVPVPDGGFTLVGRGESAAWLQARAAYGVAITPSFPLGSVEFMVGGSHAAHRGTGRPP
jgi:hypothetical protein